MPVYKKVNKEFFKKWSHNMAYVLGFLAADGSITVNPRGAHYISLQIVDRALLVSIKKALSSDHKLKARRTNPNWSTVYRIQIGSKELCNDLRKLGMHERKVRTMSLPQVPIEYLGDFVRGYFDGDGNVWVGMIHKNRKTQLLAIHTVFTSCSERFLQGLRAKLKTLGIGKGSLCHAGRAYRLQYSIKDSILLYHLMYDNLQSDLFLERKRKVFEGYIAAVAQFG